MVFSKRLCCIHIQPKCFYHSLRTKLAEVLADQLTAIVADAVLTIQKPDEPIDLYMVRICPFSIGFSAR